MTVCFECEYRVATEVFLITDKNITIGLCDKCADNPSTEELLYIQPIAN